MGNFCSKSDDITFFEKCSICYTSMVILDVKPFRCGHSIHYSCNNKLLKTRLIHRCPYCRALPKKISKFFLFNKSRRIYLVMSKYLRKLKRRKLY